MFSYFITAFIFTLIGMVPFISAARLKRLTQPIRKTGPQTHLAKSGTPTMGGLVIVSCTLLSYVLWLRAFSWSGVLLSVLTFGFASIGYLDDMKKIKGGNAKGARKTTRILLQAGMSILFLVGTALPAPQGEIFRWDARSLPLPLYLLFGSLVIISTANAANLTDGVDGLLSSTAVPTALFLMIAGKGAASPLSSALMGSILGFLVYNRYPARVMMGDTGSLAIGAAVAGSALMSGLELLLPVLCVVWVVEVLSVVMQVASVKIIGRRIFRMSPLHHHFELSGWTESQIVKAFTLASFGAAVLSFILVRCIN